MAFRLYRTPNREQTRSYTGTRYPVPITGERRMPLSWNEIKGRVSPPNAPQAASPQKFSTDAKRARKAKHEP